MLKDSVIVFPKQLGILLKSYRKSQKISQKEFSEMVGVCQSRVSYLENHPEDMSFEQLIRWVGVGFRN